MICYSIIVGLLAAVIRKQYVDSVDLGNTLNYLNGAWANEEVKEKERPKARVIKLHDKTDNP